MKPRGKTIRIYLADGTANGIRHAELGNWTGQAVLIPRALLAQVKSWAEVKRPGVYFLLGPETATSKREAYIGEAENTLVRLEQQLSKDFWEQAIVFTNKDENLTKAHVRYLEAVLIREAYQADRYKLHNQKTTDLPSLPRGDRDMLDEYVDHLKVLLGALGHPLLDPILAPVEEPTQPQPPAVRPTVKFYFSTKGAEAAGSPTPEGFVVFKGSTAHVDNNSTGYAPLKSALISDGILEPKGKTLLEFTRDYLFKSPSAAASVVQGVEANGRARWKLADGTSLKAWEEQQLAVGETASDLVLLEDKNDMMRPEASEGVRKAFHGDFTELPASPSFDDFFALHLAISGYNVAEDRGYGDLGPFALNMREHYERTGRWSGTALELWLCLYFECRGVHHSGSQPPRALWMSLYGALRERLQAGRQPNEPWFKPRSQAG